MIETVALPIEREQHASCMLTGHQIAAARRLAGFDSQEVFAKAAGISEPTLARAEASKRTLPSMGVTAMAKIVAALEAAGIEFTLEPGRSLNGGVSMRRKV